MVPSMDHAAPADAQPAPRPLPPPPVSIPGRPTSPFEQPGLNDPAGVDTRKLAGQLSPGWRLAFGICWASIVVGNAAVWESSRIIGLSTWWLGADSEPRLLLMQLLPFYGPIVVAAAAISNWRYAPYLGILVALAGGAIGAGDLDRARWIAAVELVLAGAALCVSVASLAGMYRPVRTTDAAS
jgi:hypothetical protein